MGFLVILVIVVLIVGFSSIDRADIREREQAIENRDNINRLMQRNKKLYEKYGDDWENYI